MIANSCVAADHRMLIFLAAVGYWQEIDNQWIRS